MNRKSDSQIVTLDKLQDYAKEIIPIVFEQKIIGLSGTLGAGKTTLIQLILKAIGSQSEVTSPTYSLQNIYPINQNEIKEIHHWDLYRVAAAPLELYEYLDDPHIITLIEWPEKDPELSNEIKLHIQINIVNEFEREIITH